MKVELNPENVTVDILPPVLQEMVGIIGLQATLNIVKHYGGVRLYVPQNMTPEHHISRLIGFEAALKLAREYGGQDHFKIPLAAKAMQAVKDATIARKRKMGKTVRALAYEFGMTERGIEKAANRGGYAQGQDDSQRLLF